MEVQYWRTLERHPLSAEYTDISGRAWEAYVANLRKNGIVEGRKVVIHEGLIIDGWQLFRACIETDIKPEFKELRLPEGMTAEEWVETANDLRRHETQERAVERVDARRERAAAGRARGDSFRKIAEDEGVDEKTIRDDLEKLKNQSPELSQDLPDSPSSLVSGADPSAPEYEEDGKSGEEHSEEPPGTDHSAPETTPEKVTGRDGKKYRARKLCLACQHREGLGRPLIDNCENCKALNAKPKKPKAAAKSLSEQIDEELAAPIEEPPTLEEAMKLKNSELESFCRGLMKYVEENMPEDAWLEYMGRGNGAIQKFKDGCAAIRSAKCSEICPMCKGEGCAKCQRTGRVPTYVYDQLVS